MRGTAPCKNRDISERRRPLYGEPGGHALRHRLSTSTHHYAMLKNALRNILAQKKTDGTSDWLECLTLCEEDHILRVSFPHSYFAAWFARHKRALFEEAIFSWFSKDGAPSIVYDNPAADAACNRKTSVLPLDRSKAHSEADTSHADIPNSVACHITAFAEATPKENNDDSAFTAFITNGKNSFPLAAAKEIAEQRSGKTYNPFLLCGKSGTGKSHILQAITTTIQQDPKKRVVFAPATRFCANTQDWARHPEIFWQRYDALILDDIQDLVGQDAWQRKLIICMDTCPATHAAGLETAGQMIFACSGQPQTLKALDERLRSRLESGLVVELMEPDLDVRMRYLQNMCKNKDISLSKEQLLFIAQRCPQFRLLQGLLIKVVAFCTVTGRELLQADLENIVRTGVADNTPGCLEILDEVARKMDLKPEDVLGGKRRPDLVLARQVSMYVCRQKLGLSYAELGRAFGGKDHSTVIYAIKKIKKLLVSDKTLQQLVTKLELKAQ